MKRFVPILFIGLLCAGLSNAHGDVRFRDNNTRTDELKALVKSHTEGDFNETVYARYVIEETRRSFDMAQWLQRRVVNTNTVQP